MTGLKIEGVAKALTDKGYPITKQAVGHWETGRNVPDAIWLRRLAKLYGTTLDALVWDDSISIEGIQMAAQYDGLTEKQKNTWNALWMAFIKDAATDESVELKMPITRSRVHTEE